MRGGSSSSSDSATTDSEPVDLSSDDSDNQQFEFSPAADKNRPLFKNARITVKQSYMACLTFMIMCGLTRYQSEQLLCLINIYAEEDIPYFRSLRMFEKIAEQDEQLPFERMHYCPACKDLLNSKTAKCQKTNKCKKSKTRFFLRMPILPQLQRMYKRPGFFHDLQYRHSRKKDFLDNIEDLYDGAAYKEFCREGEFLSNPYNISFGWNTDGVCPFKSSSNSYWPIYLVINELPPEKRYLPENILLIGLWYSDEKPDFNLFLGAMYQEFSEIYNGVQLEVAGGTDLITVRGLLLWGTCDLPAKALMLNMQQFNGECGCPKCKVPGKSVNRRWVYPYTKHLERYLRTDEETRESALEAEQSGKIVDGIKAKAELFNLVREPVRTTAIDAMHGVFGATGKIFEYLFDFVLTTQQLNLANERFVAQNPNIKVQRKPRVMLKKFPKWKSSEHMILFFCYSIPVFGDLLPSEYLEHFKLLQLGMHLLFRKSISPREIEIAKEVLDKFDQPFKRLYDQDQRTINIHQLVHYPQSVIDTGPLYSTICFYFENLNGILSKLINSSKRPDLQICAKFSKFTFIRKMIANEMKDSDDLASQFCHTMIHKKRKMKLTRLDDNVISASKVKRVRDTPDFLVNLLTASNIEATRVFVFTKLLKDGELYIVKNINREVRYDNSYAQYKTNNGFEIGVLQSFWQVYTCSCTVDCNCQKQYFAVAQRCELIGISTGHDEVPPFNFEIADYCEMQLIPLANLQCVCFPSHIKDTGKSYVVIAPHILQLS